MSQKVQRYAGKNVDVLWDERLCIHIGECGRAQGELFVGGRKPWCQPDLVQVGEVKDVVDRCPSGAISYTTKDESAMESAAPGNTVTVVYNGPLYVRGDLDVDGAQPDMPGVRFRAALCRCGQSQNKPFCDNAHEDANFRDYGAVGESGPGEEGVDRKLTIKRAPNGPLLLSGDFSIVAASGRKAWTGTKVALCRCGSSKNKPFCDGAHKAANFKAD